jgi:hypothetical protein
MADRTVQHLMVFPNKAELIYPFLKDVIAFIERHAPNKAHQLIFKTRVIVTELLTNSIKHTNTEPSGIELLIAPNTFTIKKIDTATPFRFKGAESPWPLSMPAGTVLTIHIDALNGLFAKVNSPYSLSFYAESYPVTEDLLTDMSEHYGLIIICRASNSFAYQYNPQSRQNIFTVTIALT